ncbi:MAG: zf-HC2 domain-containing protein [Ignavibacteriae bacterium]|nr:zf-HC2 domain-containing protein [Ignavibacteriota bacterium]
MTHMQIQERLLLYLDNELSDREMKELREHLSTCSSCAERRDALGSLWQSESRSEKMAPSPFLWMKVQARIQEFEHTLPFVWLLRKLLQGVLVRPLPALAILAAMAIGFYLGSPHEAREPVQSISQMRDAADELGLDQFDVIPPDALGSTLVNISNKQK